MIDLTSKFGIQALQKLESEMVIWLTTVTPNGTPQPRPVWFIWQENKIVIYTLASSKKMEHLKNNPNVSLNFNMKPPDDGVFVIIGKAEIIKSPIPVLQVKEYMQKYSNGIADIKMTPQSFNESCDARIEITPVKLRGD